MPGRQLLPQDNPVPPIWGVAATNSPLDVIVFSKDRACQLDALLRSMREFFLFPHRIHVLYTTSSSDYELGYDLLRRWHRGVNWVGDKGAFGLTMKELMASIDRGPGRYLMFLVDDMMFTRTFTAQGLMESLDEDEDILAVSLRMGENITYCYTRNCPTTPPDFSKGYRWAWKTASPGYWNYPMSQDAHIFRVSDFAQLLPKMNFINPNTLEATQSGRPFPRPDLVCERLPSVINIAANRVQSIYKNRCGNISAEFLNESFLQGLAIDVRPFAGQVHSACHIDVDLPLIDDERSRTIPEIKKIKKNGEAHYRIDLRDIPTFVLNCVDDLKNRLFMQEQLDDLGLDGEFIRGQRVQPGWIGVALGHLKVLRLSRAKPPFLVLEDDCEFNDRFRHVIEVPATADALYLGVSGFGLPKPGEIGWGRPNVVQWQRYDQQYLRVFNMLARHAVLYLDEDFCQAVIESQVEALTNRNFPHPGDMGLAALHASHVILTPELVMCRQTARDITNIDLPTALPDNEVKAEAKDDQEKEAGHQPRARSSKNQASVRATGECLVSHKYRFAYFPIAKNASSSLRREFSRPIYECQRIRAKDVDQSVLDDYYKFTFLRDPVARTASAYQEISLRMEMKDSALPSKTFSQMPDNRSRFITFLEQIEDGSWDEHIRPQFSFFAGIEMDFYGRVESMQSDLSQVYSTLGMGPCPLLPKRRSREGRSRDYGYDSFNIRHDTLPPRLVRKINEIYRSDIDLIQTKCPVPALHHIGREDSMSSQSMALPLDETDELSPIEFFSRINQSHAECMVYSLGDRGFYAELSTVARAMIYAWVNGLQLLLDFDDFAWSYEKGWEDYFEPFCLTSAEVDPFRITERIAFTLSGDRQPFNNMRGFQPQELDFGSRHLSGFQNILGFFVKMIFRPVKDCRALIGELTAELDLPAEYDALHIRRGDKVGDEDVFYPVADYLDRLDPLPPGRTLFVMSDAYKAVEELRDYLHKKQADVRVVTLVEPERTGFDVWKLRRGEQFMGDGAEPDDAQLQRAYIFDQTRRLLAESVIAMNSTRFVSTWLSNVGRAIWYLHPDQRQCHFLQRTDAGRKPDQQPDSHSGARATRESPLALYRRMNESLDDCMIYSLGGRGFFAEFSTVARAMIYALANKRQLLLDSDSFAWAVEQGWTDYFEPFCLTPSEVKPARIKERISFNDRESFSRLRYFEPGKLRFGETRLEGFYEILGFFMSMIFRPNQACLEQIDGLIGSLDLPEDYDAIHIRRGDKIGDEDMYFPVEDYLNPLEPLPDNRTLFVMTDDYAAVREVNDCLATNNGGPSAVTLCQPDQAGFDQDRLRRKEQFMLAHDATAAGSYDNYLYEQMVRLLAETMVALRARHFVSTKGSNVGWAVWMMHPQRDYCRLLHASSLDLRREKQAAPPALKFMAEVQLRDGLIHRFELPSDSPLLKNLRLLQAADDAIVRASPGQLVQLPLDGGRSALSFASSDLKCIRLIPEAEHPAARRKRGTDFRQRDVAAPLPVNDMKIVNIDGDDFFLFLDIFVHPSRNKIVAVMPFYNEDWNPAEHKVDVENVRMLIGGKIITGSYIPHRLDSWEPCALLDFEDTALLPLLRGTGEVSFSIRVGPHRKKFTLSTAPEPPRKVLMSLVVKNENRWIRHFLEYYLECLRVDHILVYDNGTRQHDALLEILKPYREAGTVTYIPWNYRWRNMKAPKKMIAQPQQEAHSLNRFANSRWIGFLDVDEFLRIPGKTLPEFMADFEHSDVDGVSFGLRWFHYEGALDFDEIIDPPLTFLHASRDPLGRKRQKLLVAPRNVRFLRLHSLEEGKREHQVDDSDIFFHHYCQRNYRFKQDNAAETKRDDYMLRFSSRLSLEGGQRDGRKKPRRKQQWIRHITRAIAEAESGRSRLNADALAVRGMCGTLTRHFYNNICNFRGCRYLEIGSFEGASTISAVFGNDVSATCIDNFSLFKGSREKFESNIGQFQLADRVQLVEQDCFEMDSSGMGPFDIYLYDGGHQQNSQYKAIEQFAGTLAPLAVVIIDDWNWERVRIGTRNALRDLDIPVLYEKEILLPEEEVVDMPRHRGKDSWWNGVCIMLLGRETH